MPHWLKFYNSSATCVDLRHSNSRTRFLPLNICWNQRKQDFGNDAMNAKLHLTQTRTKIVKKTMNSTHSRDLFRLLCFRRCPLK
eukprot:scaffold479270_cov28-Prasinocladus_malaysianus.AAC.1